MTGSTVLHYKVGERLGAGGMGEVYLAEDTRLGRRVALKFLAPAVNADPESRSRLLTEARAASLLHSPYVAVTHDIVEDAGSTFIVMEYVEGELLSHRLQRGRLPAREAAAIAAQVADALDEAHGRGIVHRDIKSANLMLTARGPVKVLDFGLAKFVARPADPAVTRVQVTAAGLVLGTVSYMAPEQARGRPVDARADLFSLGVVLFEMLTGRLPFDGASTMEIIDRILHADPGPPSRLAPEIPPALDTVVLRALQKDPADRYQSARDLRDDLREAERQGDGQAGRGPSAGRSRRPGAVRRTKNGVAVMTFANITQEREDDWLGTGIAESVTADLRNIRGLSVIGRAQIHDALRDLGGDPSRPDPGLALDVGRRIGAEWTVGGGYQRLGDRVRITAQFVEVRTGAVLRTVKIDGRMDDIFALQDRIVYGLSQGLNLHLETTEIAGIEREETQSVEAYEAYSRGMMNLRQASRDSLDRAINLFEKALALDPDYAAAWAALGSAYDLKGSFLSMPELVERALDVERRAIALDPTLAGAHVALGAAYLALGRPDEAVAAAREALRLEPENAAAHSGLARALWIGKGMIAEGIAALERTVALNADAGYAHLQLGLLHALQGDFRRAEAAAKRAVDLQERYLSGNEGLQVVGAHTRLGYVYYLQGRYAEAIAEYEREFAFLASSDHALRERALIELDQKLGAAYLRPGRTDEAARFFERALAADRSRRSKGTEDPYTTYYVAAVHALRGDAEGAVAHLAESSRILGALNRVRLPRDPDFASIRTHPAWAALAGDPPEPAAGEPS